VPRAVARLDERAGALARRVLGGVVLIDMDAALLDEAASVEPPGLRSLDAIHLATATLLGDELAAFLVYDTRLAAAARGAGLPVASPGAAAERER
jgi:predicted nucleic acid-binding protein